MILFKLHEDFTKVKYLFLVIAIESYLSTPVRNIFVFISAYTLYFLCLLFYGCLLDQRLLGFAVLCALKIHQRVQSICSLNDG